MLYIQEKYFNRQIDVLNFLMGLDEFEVIIWLYPESKLKHLFGFELLHCDRYQGKPVTEYNDSDVIIRRTDRQKLTSSFITRIIESKRIFIQNCDSSVLYKPGENDWYASTIGHEGVFIVTEDNKQNELILNGFKASLEKPDFW